MSGVSKEHAEIETNLIASLKTRPRARGRRVFPASMRIKVPSAPPYRNAELSALCGEPQFDESNDLMPTLKLASLECEMPLSEIFEAISFDAETTT